MEIIKFRVYDTDKKCMKYLNTEHDFICFHYDGIAYYHNKQTGLGDWFKDLMQYTGKKDKNGTEIYVGDILKHPKVEEEFHVIFEDVSFSAINNDDTNFVSYLLWNECEIVGNIYEKK